jgi:dolichol-phosphate mannosyltransferase
MFKKSLIFTATYNEYPNIKILLDKIYKLNLKLDILVIDDNSNDGTLEFLKNYSKRNFKLIIRKKKMGLDTAHKFAFRYARNHKYNYLITMDADLSHEPKVIRKIIDLLRIHSFVIGSRYIKGGKCDLKGFRFFISYLGNIFIKKILNISSNEFTTSYRGFNIHRLKKLHLNKIKSRGYSFFMETIFLINKLNIKIYEIPIHFQSRFSGSSKIAKIEIFRTLFNVLRLKFFK